MAFGSVVRRRRRALGLTLEQVAESAGLSPNYVGSIENGKHDPSLSSVLKLAKALGSTPGQLLGGEQGLGADGIEAGALVEKLPRPVRESVIELLRTLAHQRR
ncbi:hypothetical protein BH09MYX1_BH09MYX1_57260 [soil metagenome]